MVIFALWNNSNVITVTVVCLFLFLDKQVVTRCSLVSEGVPGITLNIIMKSKINEINKSKCTNAENVVVSVSVDNSWNLLPHSSFPTAKLKLSQALCWRTHCKQQRSAAGLSQRQCHSDNLRNTQFNTYKCWTVNTGGAPSIKCWHLNT